MPMAQEPTSTQPHQRPAKAGKRKVGKPNAKRPEQTRAKQGPMEGTEQDIQGHRASDGGTVERVRIVFAHELPECECCGEPWCPVHLEHYADCACLGPHNAEDEGYRLVDENGTLYALKP